MVLDLICQVEVRSNIAAYRVWFKKTVTNKVDCREDISPITTCRFGVRTLIRLVFFIQALCEHFT
jgi:hypothetical protein